MCIVRLRGLPLISSLRVGAVRDDGFIRCTREDVNHCRREEMRGDLLVAGLCRARSRGSWLILT